MALEANSSRFSFSLVTHRCKRPHGTSDTGRSSEKRSMIDFRSLCERFASRSLGLPRVIPFITDATERYAHKSRAPLRPIAHSWQSSQVVGYSEEAGKLFFGIFSVVFSTEVRSLNDAARRRACNAQRRRKAGVNTLDRGLCPWWDELSPHVRS